MPLDMSDADAASSVRSRSSGRGSCSRRLCLEADYASCTSFGRPFPIAPPITPCQGHVDTDRCETVAIYDQQPTRSEASRPSFRCDSDHLAQYRRLRTRRLEDPNRTLRPSASGRRWSTRSYSTSHRLDFCHRFNLQRRRNCRTCDPAAMPVTANLVAIIRLLGTPQRPSR